MLQYSKIKVINTGNNAPKERIYGRNYCTPFRYTVVITRRKTNKLRCYFKQPVYKPIALAMQIAKQLSQSYFTNQQ